jgi:hydrogenase maturation protease
MHDTLIAGMGNVLMGDDAAGPTVLAHLEARFTFPDGVKVLDLGTPGVDLALHLTGVRTVVLLDALADGTMPPGTIRVADRAEILAGPVAAGLDPHSPRLREALLLAGRLGDAPEQVCLIGVVAADCSLVAGMSAPVRAAIPALVDTARLEMRRLGIPFDERVPPGVPDLWWER